MAGTLFGWTGISLYATMNYSHTEGVEAEAKGYCSHAEGYKTTASGNYSHAEGYKTKASRNYSHADLILMLNQFKEFFPNRPVYVIKDYILSCID